MRTFLLTGSGGVYNYGCEAIVRGTVAILRSEWPDSRIIYASRRPDDDSMRLADCDITIVHRNDSRYYVTNIIRKYLSRAGFHYNMRIDSLRLLKGVDAVIAIGGDTYTLDHAGHYNVSFPLFGDAAEMHGTPFILWGASVGPFSKGHKAEAFYKKHLTGVSVITAREHHTIAYLSSIGIMSNVVACADPAFLVAPEIVRDPVASNGRPIIGINLSPVSLAYTGMSAEQTVATQALSIERMIDAYDAHIMLIPHVTCNIAISNDDVRYLLSIKDVINKRYADRVLVVESDSGFIGTKHVLAKCDVVIAARMHCAISATAAAVPTLLLAYSQKARGMAEYLYGHGDWVTPIGDFTSEQCLLRVGKLIDRWEATHAYLARRIIEIRADAYGPIGRMKTILCGMRRQHHWLPSRRGESRRN